jgi:hypothetical protein
MFGNCSRIWGASAVVFGVAGAIAPRRVIDIAGRLLLAGYENPEDLEPSEWYVSAVRAKFGLAAIAGAVVLALEYGSLDGLRSGGGDDAVEDEDEPPETSEGE